jgi:CrcB protein
VIWVAVAVAGALGAAARHLVDHVVHARTTPRFPVGILVVNLSGCLAAGLVIGSFEVGRLGDGWRVALATGFCGAFTTFSTYAYESIALAENDAPGLALVNVVGSLGGGLALAATGLWLASFW